MCYGKFNVNKTVLSGSSSSSLLPRRAALAPICGRLLEDLSHKSSAAGRQLAVGHQSPVWAVGLKITKRSHQGVGERWWMQRWSVELLMQVFMHVKICQMLGFVFALISLRIMFRSLCYFSIVTQFPLPSISSGSWQMHGLLWTGQTLRGVADVSCQIERST